MKPALPTLFWFALTASAFAADEKTSAPATPQPRPRLEQTTSGGAKSAADPKLAESPELPTHHPIVIMEKYTVKDTPLPLVPRPVTPTPKTFSLLNGGPLYHGKLGSLPFEAGMWTSEDFDPQGWHSAAYATRAQFDFLQIKF